MTKSAISAVLGALLAHAAVASADGETAEAAWKRGQAALKAGRVHEACQAFDASDKLDPKIDTELSLAQCFEQDGKPVAAARIYRELAEKDPNAERRKTSSEKVAKLEAKAPKLRLVLNKRPDGLVIKVDGTQVPNTGDVLVDVGPHEVTATAPGFEGHASAPVDRERATVDVIVRLEEKAQAAPEPAPAPAPAPAPSAEPPAAAPAPAATAPAPAPGPMETTATDHHMRNGAIVGAVGLGVIIGAVGFFSASSSKFDDEHALCPNSKCANDADLATAKSLLSDGHTFRGLSIGMGIGGVAILGVGAYLMLAPHEEAHVSVAVGSGHASLTYTGHF